MAFWVESGRPEPLAGLPGPWLVVLVGSVLEEISQIRQEILDTGLRPAYLYPLCAIALLIAEVLLLLQ